MKIVILAFNIGISPSITNGPGMCLYNFVIFLRKHAPHIDISVYTKLKTNSSIKGVVIRGVEQVGAMDADVRSCDMVHHWSGLIKPFERAVYRANQLNKYVVLGPNLLDAVDLRSEASFLSKVRYDKILTVNDRLLFLLAKRHLIHPAHLSVLQVGPILETWAPPEKYDEFILWKGNKSHMVKDIGFALEVEKKLPQYKFMIIGRHMPYSYDDHIAIAKRACLYFSTSLSETMGLGLAEQWAAGVPSVTHSNIYLHGKNYETGIITNRDISSYCSAITEIMEDQALRGHLSAGAERYAGRYFSSEYIVNKYAEAVHPIAAEIKTEEP